MKENCSFSLPYSDLEDICIRASSDLKSLSGAEIFLTGCTSFFGKWLIEALLFANTRLQLNLRITFLSRNPEAFLASMPHLAASQELTWAQGDLCNFNFTSVSPFTHVVHAANLPNDRSKNWPMQHMTSAITGTRNLMEAAKVFGCSTVLFTSSGAIYRNHFCDARLEEQEQPLSEKQNCSSDFLGEPHVYSLTKQFVETYITSLGDMYNIQTPLARCFAFAGPYMPLNGGQALGNFICDALFGRDIAIKSDGTSIRSYMYGADLVVWLLALLVRGRHGVPYNVGSEEAISIKSAAEMVSSCTGSRVGVTILGQSIEGNAPSVYVPEISRCKQELSLNCEYSLKRILDISLPWIQNCLFTSKGG